MCAHPAATLSRNRLWPSLVVLWLALVVLGTSRLELFAATPGQNPGGASLTAGARFHLYLFLHPLCECSNASIHELERLIEHSQSRIEVTAVIDNAGFAPKEAQPLMHTLSTVPGIAVQLDANGTTTASFGAKTSGQILLYDAAGALAFSGGITSERAHEGDNAGETAILDIVNGDHPLPGRHPASAVPSAQA